MSNISEAGLLSAALARIGSASVQDVQATDKSRLAYILYKRIRDRYQMSYPWSFCQQVSALNQVATDDQDGTINDNIGYQYVMPSDCSRAVGLLPLKGGTKWRILGENLITYSETPKLLYLRIVSETGKFPEWFTEAVVSRLAMELVPKSIGTKESLRTDLRNEALVAWNEATATDSGVGYFVREEEDEYDRSSFVMPYDLITDSDLNGSGWQR